MATTALREHPLPGTPALERLLAQVAEGAAERERAQEAPFAAIALVKESRLGALRVPADEGGGGTSLRQLFEVLMSLAEADSNVAHILRVHFAFTERVRAGYDPEHRAHWIGLINEGKIFGNATSEQNGRQVGMKGFETTLVPDPSNGGYRLRGEKFYST